MSEEPEYTVEDKVYKMLEKIETKDDFINFVDLLAEYVTTYLPHWEQVHIREYIKAIGGAMEDIDGFYHKHNLEVPTEPSWRTFAMTLLLALNPYISTIRTEVIERIAVGTDY